MASVAVVALELSDGNLTSEDLFVEGNFVEPQFYRKMKVFEEETCAFIRLCLEEKLVLVWPFEFGIMTINAWFNI